MRRVGLIGGMSWESTAVYYRRLNEQIRNRLGGLHSADLLLRSVDFESIVQLQKAGDWAAASAILQQIAVDLQEAGADCILICTNTMHLMADDVQAAIDIPLLNIIDLTAERMKDEGYGRPLVLATRYTMESDFYIGRMSRRHGIEPMVPDEAGRTAVHDVIFNELCQGKVLAESRAVYLALIEQAAAAGADSIVFGCTEVGLLISQEDCSLPTFDSTLIHADAAAEFALTGIVPRSASAAEGMAEAST